MLLPFAMLASLMSLASAMDVVRMVHFANMNHSLFTDYLYDRTNAVCFTASGYPTNSYMEKFTDTTDAYFDVDIGGLDRRTVEVNVTSGSIYYDLAYKSIEQRVEYKGLNGQPDEVLYSIKVAKSVAVNATTDSYDVDITFQNANCSKSFTAFVINNASVFSQKVDCVAGVYGSVTTQIDLSLITTYGCLTHESKSTLYADTTTPSVGMLINFHYSLETGSVFRAKFPEIGYSYPAEGPLDYKDLLQTLEYGLKFESKAPSGTNQLRIVQTLMNTTISYVDPACTSIAAEKCVQCKPEFQFVNGGCQCTKNGTIEEFRKYPVSVVHSTDTVNSTYFQENCRVLGSGLDEASANCETQIDYFLKRKYYIAMSTSTLDSGVVNISLINIDPGLNDAAKSCANYHPTLSVYLIYQGTNFDVGDYSMGHLLLADFKPDLTQARVDTFLAVNSFTNKIKHYCKTYYLQEVKTVYECELHAKIGPASNLISQEQMFRLNVLNFSSPAKRELVDVQVVNMNYTKSHYDSLFKSDQNMRVRVLTYNQSNTELESVNYADRFVRNTFGRFEKHQIVRFEFEIVNLTMTSRYSLADYKRTAVISDSSAGSPYVGDKCNSTYYNTSFYQSLILDCHFDLQNNITYSVDLYLYKRDLDIYPETITVSHVFMFEVYQIREKIALAGLGKTATIIVIVIILLLMTAAMCYLAVKAGAADNIDIDNIKDNIKGGVKEGVSKVKDMYKTVKKNVKDKYKEERNKTKELRQNLIDEEDAGDSKQNDSKLRKGKKKRRQTESDDEDIVPESLKKNDISAIKPHPGVKQSDSQEDIFEITKKPKKKKLARDSDEEDIPKKNISGSRLHDTKAITPVTPKNLEDDLRFDSQDDVKKFDDSEDEEYMERAKAKKNKGRK